MLRSMWRALASILLLLVMAPSCALVTDFSVTLGETGGAAGEGGAGGMATGGGGAAGGAGAGGGGGAGAGPLCLPVAPSPAPDCAEVAPCGSGGAGGGCGTLLLDDVPPARLTADAASIFLGTDTELRRIPKPGCEGQLATFVLPEDAPTFMALHGDALFWSRNGPGFGLMRCDPEQCEATRSVVGPSAHGGDKYNGHADGPGAWVYAARTDGPVVRLSRYGCELEVLATDTANGEAVLLHDIAVAGEQLFWTRFGKVINLTNSGAVMGLDLAGGQPLSPSELTATDLHAPLGALVAGDYFFFRRDFAFASRIPIAGGPIEDAPPSGFVADGFGGFIAVKGHVYLMAFEAGQPVIVRMPVETFDTVEVAARAPAGLIAQFGFWVDDDAIYWSLGTSSTDAELWMFPL